MFYDQAEYVISFAKLHGAGNGYLVVDGRASLWLYRGSSWRPFAGRRFVCHLPGAGEAYLEGPVEEVFTDVWPW